MAMLTDVQNIEGFGASYLTPWGFRLAVGKAAVVVKSSCCDASVLTSMPSKYACDDCEQELPLPPTARPFRLMPGLEPFMLSSWIEPFVDPLEAIVVAQELHAELLASLFALKEGKL